MTIDRANVLLKVQSDFAGAYNRHSCALILAEVSSLNGQAAVDQLIQELELDRIFDFEIGQSF
ncbi:MAG: hypothetical protein WBM41_01640 [Arenicellales bacterium]